MNRPIRTAPRLAAPPLARAFTLIEVLMGVLILALALLGIGAILPVVIRTQKAATDATLGVSVANAVEALLAGRSDLNRLTPPPIPPPGTGRMGWGVWLLDQNWSPAAAPVGTATPANANLWEPLLTTGGAPELDPLTGQYHLQFSGSNPASPVTIEVADRLWPPRNSTGTTPQFVWDFIARRMHRAAGQPERIQLAVFVRRLDPNIRVPGGLNLYEVVSGYEIGTYNPVALADRRLPVAVNPGPGAATGIPTLNGVGDYAAPLVLDLEDVCLDPARRDRIHARMPPSASTSTAPEFPLATQVGQKWVDNLGNVFTVRGIDPRDPTGTWVLVDPPVPSWVRDVSTGTTDDTTIRQVAFVPQVPAAVSVITLTPSDPK